MIGVEPPAGLLVDDPVLGRRIRGGDWADQGVATYRKIGAALGEERWDDATALARYFVVEAEVCYRLYRQWLADLRVFLLDQGTAEADLAAAEDRIAGLLVLPDGSAWDPERQWALLGEQVERFAVAASDGSARTAGELLETFVETWRRGHDRDVDHICGLMNEVVTQYGEAAIGPMYDHLLLPWFNARYSLFDVDKHPWARALTLNMMVAFEAMRGHMCGPGRRGDVEFEELPDRYVLRFDPCGSGGRSVRGEPIEGTLPRMEAPYEWPVTREPAPWNHGQPGVCVYCAHCIVLTEIMPIDAFGYPVRAVDPPRYPATADAKCSWTMFKDPTRVPEEYYTRVGRARPDQIGSDACGGVPGREE
ncbi:hypothetical protein [Spongiactinospora sp. 9N601]|uniref:hypothetical protein n=1 Tax=Spongiactinospora sp. 9N601 TaxID=3375149 RepID=UPI0037B099C8